MLEPDLIQQQRAILRAFRAPTTQRAQAEADAEDRRKAECTAAEAELARVRSEVEGHLTTVRKAQEDAKSDLAKVGLQALADLGLPAPAPMRAGADPAQEMVRAVASAADALKSVQNDTAALVKWRQDEAERRDLLIFLGPITFVLLVFVIAALLAEYIPRAAEQRANATREAVAEATRQALEATRQAVAEAAIKAGPVLVPAGEFLMGSTDADHNAESDEKPQHKVYLDAYLIDRTEVTNGMYARCVTAGACKAPASSSSRTRGKYYDDPRYANYPVIIISWDDAQAYCRWAGGRLPTEAEWEKAARGTDGRLYPWGNEPPNAQSANYGSNVGDTTSVGAYPEGASPYGVLDMAGNVWEWVADWYDAEYYASAPARNPQGAVSGQFRVLRGGSWFDEDSNLRAASRAYINPEAQPLDVGFRCVTASGE